MLIININLAQLVGFGLSENAFREKGVKGAMQCVTDSASTIGLWASSPVAPDLQLHYHTATLPHYHSCLSCPVSLP